MLRLGRRQGDCAEIAQIELVGSEYDPSTDQVTETTEETVAGASKGVGSRLRAAAKRLRGGREPGVTKDAE